MKTMALIGLILVAAVSTSFAADTLMTIQTNTTIKIDPVTGLVKGDAQTQVKGINKHPEPPPLVNTSGAGTSSDSASAATTPATTTTAADAGSATAPVSAVSATDPNAGAAPVGTAPSSPPCPTCPAAQASGGQQN